ncbi:hypothetical protein AGMMS50212_14060 [Spirochaetia bacterium]|nr:hypothetical protein AGMMS50212_14060 [Spirochaetia bacterium]
MKNKIFAGILFLSISLLVYSQEGPSKIPAPEKILYLDIDYIADPLIRGVARDEYGFGFGIGYEWYITDFLSIHATFGFADFFKLKHSELNSVFMLDIIPQLRFYPFGAAPAGLFLGYQIGYEFVFGKYKNRDDSKETNAFGHVGKLSITFFGYKFIITDLTCIEISAGYALSFGNLTSPMSTVYDYQIGIFPNIWRQSGFKLDIAFGWAVGVR